MIISYQHVILNVVKNLNTSTSAFQILRDAQDDNLVGEIHLDTPLLSFLITILLQPLQIKSIVITAAQDMNHVIR